MMSCPLCGFKDIHMFLSLNDYSYFRCNYCSLVFLDRDIPFDSKKIYTSKYIRERGLDVADSYVVKAKQTTARFYLSHLKKYSPKGNLLEIGCSTGITLNVAREMGWEVFGVEINEAAAQMARKPLNINTIETNDISDINEEVFPDNFFSEMLLFDILEHIHEPLEFMKSLTRKLANGGYILLITPNINSLSARILKEKWFHLFPEHVCLYSPKSLKLLLDIFKLKPIKIGWGIKFVNVDILEHHLACYPNIFMSKLIRSGLKHASILKRIIFPFNIGETYALVQKQ